MGVRALLWRVENLSCHEPLAQGCENLPERVREMLPVLARNAALNVQRDWPAEVFRPNDAFGS